MDIAAYISLLILLSYMLVQAADMIEGAFVLVSRKLGIRPFVIGFIVLSMASSLPEVSLVINASISQVPGLSLGNLVGGTIVLMTLVVGINAFKHKQLPFRGNFGIGQVLFALAILACQILVIFDGQLTQLEGVLLLLAYAALAIYFIRRGNEQRVLHEHAKIEVGKLTNLLIKAFVGVLGLIILAKLLVDVAIHTAGLLNIPASVIGLLVLALGTNLPEIAIAIRGDGSKAGDLSIGNLLGSASVNTAIIGLLAILSPYEITNSSALVPSLIVLSTVILLFGVSAWTDKKITRYEAALLVGVYLTLLLVEGLVIYQGIH
jgi:cation:H+ antiporter